MSASAPRSPCASSAPAERTRALALSRGLRAAGTLLAQGERGAEALTGAVRRELAGAELREDYVSLVDAESLAALPRVAEGQRARLLVAAFAGTTRLIDNGPLQG